MSGQVAGHMAGHVRTGDAEAVHLQPGRTVAADG